MAFIEENNSKTVRLVLTDLGKKLFLETGLLPQLKYYSLIDSNVIYTANVEPNKYPDLNGSHDNSTAYKDKCKHKIIK